MNIFLIIIFIILGLGALYFLITGFMGVFKDFMKEYKERKKKDKIGYVRQADNDDLVKLKPRPLDLESTPVLDAVIDHINKDAKDQIDKEVFKPIVIHEPPYTLPMIHHLISDHPSIIGSVTNEEELRLKYSQINDRVEKLDLLKIRRKAVISSIIESLKVNAVKRELKEIRQYPVTPNEVLPIKDEAEGSTIEDFEAATPKLDSVPDDLVTGSTGDIELSPEDYFRQFVTDGNKITKKSSNKN